MKLRIADVLPAFGITIVFVVGLAGGYFLASLPFRTAIRYWKPAASLGSLCATESDRAGRASAFLDPDIDPDELYNYGWVAPNAHVPFLGTMTAPQVFKTVTVQSDLTRGLRPVEMPKPGGEVRVFLTGGSTAFSVGAPSHATTIGGYLEKRLREETGRDVRVYVFCAPAWTTTHERIAITNRISEWSPDIVVSLSGVNDMTFSWMGSDTFLFRSHYERTFHALVEASYRLALQPVPTDPVVTADEPVPMSAALHRLEKNVRISRRVLADVGARYVWALQPALVTTGKRLTEREQSYLQKIDEGRVDFTTRGYEGIRKVLSVISDDGFVFTDTDETFRSLTARDEVFLDQYHFGDRGNRHVADHLAKRLQPLITTL